MADDVKSATFKGAGGGIMTFDLPMHEVYANQLLKGDLKPADDDARAYLASLQPDPPADDEDDTDAPEPPEEDEEPPPVEAPPKAGPGSGRKTWAAWAEAQGVAVNDDDTRDDIIAKMEDA